MTIEQIRDDREEHLLEPRERAIEERRIRPVILKVEVHQWFTTIIPALRLRTGRVAT